jgi:hypothetical protein
MKIDASNIQGIRNMACREVNAENNFRDAVMAKGFSEADAWLIFGEYRKRKAIKLDRIGGRYVVKHGALWDIECLQRGLEFAKAR